MKRKLTAIAIVLCTLSAASAQVTMQNTRGSGGSVIFDDNKGYDIKGQPVIGVSTGGGVTGYWGAGYQLWGAGGEPIIPTYEANEGYIILTIQRDGNSAGDSISVTYQINPESGLPQNNQIDVYRCVGNGDGQYTLDAAPWQAIILQSIVVAGEPSISIDTAQKKITFANQVGLGNNEIYVKALPAGYAKTNLQNELAVGKVNVALGGTAQSLGKNLVSVPFRPHPGTTVAEVFGEGSDSVWQTGDLLQLKLSGAPQYLSAYYDGSAGKWRNAADTSQDPAFQIGFQSGEWVLVKKESTISLVGKVINSNQPVQVFDGAGLPSGGKTLLGMVHPVMIGLTATSLIADGAKDGDMIQYKMSPLDQAYISAIVSGGQWKNAADTAQPLDARIASLKIPYAYTFVRYGNDGFTWNKVKPY